jgi:hypothetical protein
MVLLKIPVVGLLLLVRWAVRQEPEPIDGDGGIGPRLEPVNPRPNHPRPRLPRSPRRGPHGVPSPQSPARVRSVIAHGGLVRR